VHALAFALALIAFVPLDDRPVTRQLPQMLGTIAGASVIEPPRALLGDYLSPGRPDAIASWLNGPATKDATSFVLSTDMLAYGGLVASRTPQTPYADAYFRLRELAQLRRAHPHAWIAAFGTVMRLAPTGVPAIGDAAGFFAAYPGWKYLQEYANLHDPPLPSETARATALKGLIGPDLLDGYLAARARDYGTDVLVLRATSRTVDRSVLGQDDAGPVGLHVKEVAGLQGVANDLGLDGRTSIEPGADELGMALVAHALARRARWTPRVRVAYSTPDGAAYQDKLEFAPIATAIGGLVSLCGGTQVDGGEDVTLYVRVPGTTVAQDDALLAAMHAAAFAGKPVAFADLAFLTNDYASQAAFAARMLGDGTMGRIDAYASWNTNANTVGTALAEAVAAGAGRRMHAYDALAHRAFTFNRVLDDVVFHTEVRPDLNRALDARGVNDHTYLLPEVAAPIAARARDALWSRAIEVLAQMYPDDHLAAIGITLPWNRTFETEIDARIAPNL